MDLFPGYNVTKTTEQKEKITKYLPLQLPLIVHLRKTTS